MIYQSPSIVVNIIENNIAELSFCSKARVNVLNLETLSDLNKAINQIYNQPELTGLVLTSNKESFIVGADIKEFLTLFSKPEAELSSWLEYANSIFNKLEDLPFPTVSAIRGHVLGGGCECVLATDFRIGDKTTSIGQPETKLGIMPGFGGTVRLPRVVGAKEAATMIATGDPLNADKALAIGLLDQVITDNTPINNNLAKENKPENKLLDLATTIIKQVNAGQVDWYTKRQLKKSALFIDTEEAEQVFSIQNMPEIKNFSSQYPAPEKALQAMVKALPKERDEALKVEQTEFIQLAKSQQAEALISGFLKHQSEKKQKKEE